MADQIVFIPHAGACMTTKNVLSGVAPVLILALCIANGTT